jgi:hypothetical protein
VYNGDGREDLVLSWTHSKFFMKTIQNQRFLKIQRINLKNKSKGFNLKNFIKRKIVFKKEENCFKKGSF